MRSATSAATRACTRPRSTRPRNSGSATTGRPTPSSSATTTPAVGWQICTVNAFAACEGVMNMALAEVFERVAGPDAPVEFEAFDGSSAGAPSSPVKITVKSKTAVSYLAQAPGALGLARAYVSGHLDVIGDMYSALARMAKAQTMRIGWPERLRLLRELGGPRVLVPRIPPPPQEVRVRRRSL